MSEQQGTTVEYVSPDDLTLTDEYQVMDDLDAETYQAIKVSIETDGFDDSNPIIVDGDGNVLDGHHRLEASREAGLETVPVVRKTGLTHDEKRDEAFAQNLQRRNLDAGATREVVKTYLTEDFTPEQTQAEVATLLGVSAATVTRARNDLEADTGVDVLTGEEVAYHSREEKRAAIRDALETRPDASIRDVADDLDVSKPTVRSVRDSLESEKSDPDESEPSESGESDESERTDDAGKGTKDFTERFGGEGETETETGSGSETDNDSHRSRATNPPSNANAGSSGGASTDPEAQPPDLSEDTRAMMDAVADHDRDESGGEPESAPSSPSPVDTKKNVRDVLADSAIPLTSTEVAQQVPGDVDEREVKTALSGLTVHGPAESSPPNRKVWWLTERGDRDRDEQGGER